MAGKWSKFRRASPLGSASEARWSEEGKGSDMRWRLAERSATEDEDASSPKDDGAESKSAPEDV